MRQHPAARLALAVSLLAAAPAASQGLDSSLHAILRKARSGDAAVRTQAYVDLLAAGEPGVAALRDLLTQKEKKDAEAIEAFARSSAFSALRGKLKKEILERRAAALEIILDPLRYPDDAHGAAGQAAVDERLDAIRQVYETPTRFLRPKTPALDALLAALEENRGFHGAVGFERGRFADVEDAIAFLDERFDTRSLAMDKNKKAFEEVLDYNETVVTSASEIEREVVRLTNEYRILMGFPPVEIDERLMLAARKHSDEMEALDYFHHESPIEANKTPDRRARREGYTGGVTENCAMGRSAESAVSGWIRSSGHHRNLLGSWHRQIGVGASAGARGFFYFTQNFGAGSSLRGRRVQDPRVLYAERAARIKEGDAASHFQLAKWCRQRKLEDEMRAELLKVIAVDPEHAAARKLLGFVKVNDAWLTREQKAAAAAAEGDLGPLLSRLKDPDANARRRAIAELVKLPSPRTTKALVQALEDAASDVRAEAARALGSIGDRQAAPALRAALKDRDFFTRHASAAALYSMGIGDGIPVLISGLRSSNIDERSDAGKVLEEATGERYGFRWDLPESARSEIIRRYESWWSSRS